jgi:hypothetical protein
MKAMRLRTFLPQVSLLLAACAGPKAAEVGTGPARALTSSAREREALSLTVYNQDFGVVRERRRVALGVGRVELAYADVAAKLEPETVHLTSASDAKELTVLEQNYRYDLLSPQKLLEKYVGKTIKVYRYNEKLGTDEAKTAEVLAQQDGVVLRIDGQLTYDFHGRYAFPELPKNLVEKPTLVWLLDSAAPKQSLEVTYLTGGLDWSADYVLLLAENDASGALSGWVSLTNASGASFENAELKLVAGDVQRAATAEVAAGVGGSFGGRQAAASPPAFKQEGLFEYHLYTLSRPTSIRDNEKKQVSLLEADGISVKKRLVLEGYTGLVQPLMQGRRYDEKVGVVLEIANEKANRLGEPLPSGTVRVYKADASGASQFIGEDRIDHTPQGEKLRVKVGYAFDVIAERKQLKSMTLDRCVLESSWEITLRNHKDVPQQVEIDEPTFGDYEIVTSSHPPRKIDATKLAFDVSVPARGETKLTYTMRVRGC